MSRPLKEQYATTPLFGSNAAAVEAMYEKFLESPDSVPKEWRAYFASLSPGGGDVAHGPIRAQLLEQQKLPAGRRSRVVPRGASVAAATEKQAAVSRMIQVYSLRGHQIADLDPLGLMERHMPGVLKLDFLGLSEADMETEFFTGGLAGTGDRRMKLRDIYALLKRIYCGKIGAEFAHISRSRERLWLRKRFEQGMVSNV
ncbi:MAG: 2-oxoglutarate dehydrogenase E1 component, partial [Pseudomonadota bacterium]